MIRPHERGVTLTVRAQPGAKKNAIGGVQAGALKVSVTAPAQDGRANEALVELLATELHCRRSQIELLSGSTNRNKAFLLQDLTVEELTQRLKPWMA